MEVIGTNQNHSDPQETHFQSEDDQALAQVAQADSRVSILRDIPKPLDTVLGNWF